jgi:acetyl-CoA C-acetyltransferase
MKIKDVDAIEINEAFAAQTLACVKELKIDLDVVNNRGGAIALGHPLGSSGSRILGTLISRLRADDQEFGLATLCIGVGQGAAMLVKRV